MDALGTIQHDFSTPRLDDTRRRSRKQQMSREYREWWYTKHQLVINPKWDRCFTGREEYT